MFVCCSIVDDEDTTPFNTPVNIDVLDNDTPSEGNKLTVHSIVSDPSHGTVSIHPDGTVTYTPEPGFDGTDSFTYRVCHSETNQCDEATVTVTVEPRVGDDVRASEFVES